ncbi:MAG TPA: Amuc_1100 family pilus-like protein [Verrucomicrobiae bacterium]|nr:Amuc_1100 family pilus-like protein [Verrucomicrobiae bacterium]
MGWIKRNLGFTIGGAVALLLLGASLFYVYQSMSRNSAAFDKLNDIYGNLRQVTSQKPGPGKNGANTQTAKEQEKQLRDWIAGTVTNFQAIEPIPAKTPVSSESFASALHITIDQLQHEAEAASVMLPPRYGFSFEAERSLVKFAPEGLPALTVQLGEVKAISKILFDARVNGVDGIQRLRVSPDDANGPQGDYFDGQVTTGDMVTATPYLLTFRSFSSEISQVLGNFAKSSHGFVVKNVNVQPAAGVPMGTVGPGGEPNVGPGPGQPGPMAGRGGLQTVLKEQLLRVTMEVDIVKLQPKS